MEANKNRMWKSLWSISEERKIL